jgi:hypothetical protein
MVLLVVAVLIAFGTATAACNAGARQPAARSSAVGAAGSGVSQPSGTTTVAPEPNRSLDSTQERTTTREEYERRERMLEGTHLPGPTPPPPLGMPTEGPKPGTETIPSGK